MKLVILHTKELKGENMKINKGIQTIKKMKVFIICNCFLLIYSFANANFEQNKNNINKNQSKIESTSNGYRIELDNKLIAKKMRIKDERGNIVNDIPLYKKTEKTIIRDIKGKKYNFKQSNVESVIISNNNSHFIINKKLFEKRENVGDSKILNNILTLKDLKNNTVWEKDFKNLIVGEVKSSNDAKNTAITEGDPQKGTYTDKIEVFDYNGNTIISKVFTNSALNHMEINDLKISEDGKYVMFTDIGTTIYVLNIITGKEWKVSGWNERTGGKEARFENNQIIVDWKEKVGNKYFVISEIYDVEGNLVKKRMEEEK